MKKRSLNIFRRIARQDQVIEKFDALEEKISELRQEIQQTTDRDKFIDQVNYTKHNLYLHLSDACA